MSDPDIGNALWNALEASVTLVEYFKKKHEREPTDAEIRLAATIFIQEQRNGGNR